MKKVIAAINMTIDGFCDHTAGIADNELHQHYNKLVDEAGAILWGRITYQLMESSWPPLVLNPSGNKPIDEFAVLIENIPKIVFSNTLTGVDWKNARLAKRGLKEEVIELKKQSGNYILIGSPSLVAALTRLNLIDEFQLCVHPVILGTGLPLFKNIDRRIVLDLTKTKKFESGAIVQYYVPTRK